MGDILARLGAVNPLVWVALALLAVLGFGAKKWVQLMKIPEEKQLNATIIIKSVAVGLLVLVFLFIVATQ